MDLTLQDVAIVALLCFFAYIIGYLHGRPPVPGSTTPLDEELLSFMDRVDTLEPGETISMNLTVSRNGDDDEGGGGYAPRTSSPYSLRN